MEGVGGENKMLADESHEVKAPKTLGQWSLTLTPCTISFISFTLASECSSEVRLYWPESLATGTMKGQRPSSPPRPASTERPEI